MSIENHPGYLGLTSEGVIAIHADWPAYAVQRGWLAALISLCMFPAGTSFVPLGDIDRCILLLARGIGGAKDPFSAKNFHVALWHADALELAQRGFVRGVVGTTEREHVRFARSKIAPPTKVNSPRLTPSLYVAGLDGVRQKVDYDWMSYDNEWRDWPYISSTDGLGVTTGGWHHLDEVLSARFVLPSFLATRLTPILDAGLYDVAVREVTVHLEHIMRLGCHDSNAYGQKLVDLFIRNIAEKQVFPESRLKVLRLELRTAFKFVRNEFAHKPVDLDRSRGLSLLDRMCELCEAATRLTI